MNVLRGELTSEKECMPKCRSRQHAALLLSCMTKGSSAEIRSYSSWLCHNFGTITDNFGRNLLHIAASTGKWEIVEWLINHCHCSVDIRDHESGWTALHRSFYYGQILAAQTLLNHGASLRTVDHDGLTPLDLLIEDRLPFIEYDKTFPQDVYVWGANTNFNLGIGNEQSRAYPELLDLSDKGNSDIKQVVMCKFHTVFLRADGGLLTCGHGHGGRLGQGSEVTELTPSPVHGLGDAACEMVAAGQDHIILLMKGGQVWSCGLNMYHQLGHNPPPERLVKPKPLSLKFLKGKEILGVCAARYHTVFYTKDSLYTFGLNAGQLGHPKGPRTHILPHQVSGVYCKDWEITHVAASDGATVCASNRGDVYVLHEFQHRKIASRQLEIHKLSIVGGNLDPTCDAVGIREGGGLELKVLLLTKSGKLYLWRQSNPYLRRCLFTSDRQLVISDMHLSHNYIAMVTLNNQGYLGTILPFKEKGSAPSPPSAKSQLASQLNLFLDRDDCDFIRAKRLPHVHRATSITSDSKGRNFAVLQNSPKVGLLELPSVSSSCMLEDFRRFYNEACVDDCVHDLIIQVGHREYAVHKYILASRSEYFKKQITTLDCYPLEKTRIVLENIVPEALEQALQFLYYGTCDFFVEGKEITWINKNNNEHILGSEVKITSKKKKKKGAKNGHTDLLKCTQQACKLLSLNSLAKRLETVQLINGKVHILFKCDKSPQLKFDSSNLSCFQDVTLRSSDDVEFPCHKCVLVARSDYFRSMMGTTFWIEKTCLESISLPIPSRALEVLIQYFYSDAEYVTDLQDSELLCQILGVADQLLVTRLKEMCERALVSLLTLKNAPELLMLSCVYNASQLKKSCMQFICINLPSIVEAKNLNVISDEIMEELTRMYRKLVRRMQYRVITPNPDIPHKEELQNIEKLFPVDEHADFSQKQEHTKTNENKLKSRRWVKSQSLETEVAEVVREHKDSVSSEKDIFLDAVKPLSNKENPVTKEEKHIPVAEGHSECKKPGQWVLKCPKPASMVSLNQIMEEERKMTVLKTPSNSCSEPKRLPHLSQKQKKQLAMNAADFLSNKQEVKSPPACPWAKVNETASMPCIWDEETFPKRVHRNSQSSVASSPPISEPLSVSFEEIQRAEAEEIHQSQHQVIKPLHVINVEDQAIEELLALYKADGNPDEKITVSRVLPERIARPVWKKHALLWTP